MFQQFPSPPPVAVGIPRLARHSRPTQRAEPVPDNRPPHRWPDSPAPVPGSPEWDWLRCDQEARQRHEDRELLRRLCELYDTTPPQLARMMLRLLAPGIGELVAELLAAHKGEDER
jgi:hypothetical protein